MKWFFSIFFAAVVVCAVIYLVQLVRTLASKQECCPAVVSKRYKEEFPFSVAFARKNRMDYYLVFTLEDGRELPLPAAKDLYDRCPAGTQGLLTYQSGRLVRFDIGAGKTTE